MLNRQRHFPTFSIQHSALSIQQFPIMSDLFEELSRAPAPPPPPASLERRVHDRLNNVLAVLHVVEFFVRAVPYALFWFARGVGGWVYVALTGRQAVENRRSENFPFDRDSPG